MRHFTTVCDSKYLSQGLALYNSLMKVNPDFTLYWGCMDEKTFDVVGELPNVKPSNTWKIFNTNGFSHKEYCWSLASRYTDFVLKQFGMPDITYLDADLYFYQDYEYIYKEIGNKSVGLVEHRLPAYKTVGKYNVGFVYFKNDIAGIDCLHRWRELVSNKDNKYFKEYGQCGDQKYLELFEQWHPNDIHIINCGHGSWWSNRFFQFKDDYIIWNKEKQLFIYMHYSHFKLTDTGYSHDEMKEMSPKLKEYYDNYEIEVRKCEQKLKK